jgi:hypothetical protein
MMKDRNIDIFGMAKVKMKGHEWTEKNFGDGYKLVYAVVDTSRCMHGVSIIV